MRIGIDIDDTITNSIGALKRFIHGNIIDGSIKNGLQYKKDHVLKNNEIENKMRKFFTENNITIANNMTIKPNARKILNKLHEEGYEIYIISARSNNYYKNAYEFCYNYLKRKNIYFDKLITSQIYKEKVCKKEHIDLMIDDSVETCELIKRKGINTLLFNSENNKNIKTSCDRVNTWLELYEYIHKL